MNLFFDDIEIGTERQLGTYAFTRDNIVEFAKKFDPQAFHLSEEAAAKTHFRKLCASGWHTASAFMKCLVARRHKDLENAEETGVAAPRLGPSPGFRNLKWRRPVYVGDVITYTQKITGKTPSKSKPEWGVLHALNIGTNQDGEVVFSLESNVFLERRASS